LAPALGEQFYMPGFYCLFEVYRVVEVVVIAFKFSMS